VKLSDLKLNQGQPVGKLTVAGGRTYSGNVSSQLVPTEPFKFLPGSPKP